MTHRCTGTLGPVCFLATLVAGLWPASGSPGAGEIGTGQSDVAGVSAFSVRDGSCADSACLGRPETVIEGLTAAGGTTVSQGRAIADR